MNGAPHDIDIRHIPEAIPQEMHGFYALEVKSLIREMEMITRASEDGETIAGDTLLHELYSKTSAEGETVCTLLEWMVDELNSLLALQSATFETNPDYLVGALQELLDRCGEKLSSLTWSSKQEIEHHIAGKRMSGIYKAEAELLMLSHEIGSLAKNETTEEEDLNALALTLERKDFTKMMAHLAPEVRTMKKQVLEIRKITLPGNADDILSVLQEHHIH